MYTILVNEANELVTTVKERIMQRSKLVDNLHFLVEQSYKGIDMSDFTVMMEYIMPISREYKTEILVKSDELYKDRLEYTLPFDTNLTKEHGKVELQLTFVKAELDDDGNAIQQVRKTSPATITIVPISAWSDIIADDALTALDQRIIMTQAMLEAANEMANYLDSVKADNIMYDDVNQTLQLTANGNAIGDQITLNCGTSQIIEIRIDTDGNLVVVYSSGEEETIGKMGQNCAGIYVPSYSTDGIMTFTLKEQAEEQSYSFDINPSNDWNEIASPETNSNYIWEEL